MRRGEVGSEKSEVGSEEEDSVLTSDLPLPTSHFRLPPSHRLRTRLDFSAVYDARVKRQAGPLLVFALPNQLGHPRLGTSISRKVGNSVHRHRIKRLLRESFRLGQHELPGSYDWLIVVRPHVPLRLGEYQRMLSSVASDLHAAWSRRSAGHRPSTEGTPV